MSLENLTRVMLPAVESELKVMIELAGDSILERLQNMLSYHMGWVSAGEKNISTGKRIRPLLLLLSSASAGGEWEQALPAAAGVELIHNFSLIHDDIQDNSPLRRGRPALWVKWGLPHGINAGDAMFTLAHLAILRLEETTSPALTLKAARWLHTTCLELTQGQYLDLEYESKLEIGLDDYQPMIERKTASLLATSSGLGALVAGVEEQHTANYREFGRCLGIAFQIQDDLLGIWGDQVLTGKSNESDLTAGKKSLPVLFGLAQNGEFARRWRKGPITPEDLEGVIRLLESEGARQFAQEQASKYTQKSLTALDRAQPQGEAGKALRSLTSSLLRRQD